jgi:hypothetical protein
MLSLLEKAQVYSMRLGEIGERLKKPLTDESLPAWKVEMAVDAAGKFLKEIFGAIDATLSVKNWEQVSIENVVTISYLHPLIPIALGIALHKGDLIEEMKKLRQTAENWRGLGKKRASHLSAFLADFRKLANSVVEKGMRLVSFDTVNSLVGKHLSDLLPSESLRRHIVVALSDILRIIAVPTEEVEVAINQGLKNLKDLYSNTLFDDQELRGLGFLDDQQIRLARLTLAPAAMLQYYVNRLAAGKAHNVLPQVFVSLNLIPKGLITYFSILPWAALSPAAREEKSHLLKVMPSPYVFLASSRGIVTTIGRNLLAVNMGAGYKFIEDIGKAMGVELKDPGWLRAAYTRKFPYILSGFVKSLSNVLTFLRDKWDMIGDKIDPDKTPILYGLVTKLGLLDKDPQTGEPIIKDSATVRSVIDDKLAALDNISGVYKDVSNLVRGIPDYVLSLSEAVDWALGTSEREILSNINNLLVEVGVYFILGAEERLKFMRHYVDQAFFGPHGDYVDDRFGLIRLRSEGEKGRRVVEERKNPVGEAIADITSYIIDGPSEGETYVDWFEKVKGGIGLLLLGDVVQGPGADYWRSEHPKVDWDSLARTRPKIGLYLKLPAKEWFNLLRQKGEEVQKNGQSVHESLRMVVCSAWKNDLTRSITSSTFKDIISFQAKYPEALEQHLRSALNRVRTSRVSEISLQDLVGEEGRPVEEVIAAGEPEISFTDELEGLAEGIVKVMGLLVSEAIDKGEATTLKDAFFSPQMKKVLAHLYEAIRDKKEFLGIFDDVLNSLESSVERNPKARKEWNLSPNLDLQSFVSLIDRTVDKLLEFLKSEGEEATPDFDEVAENVWRDFQAELTEERAEGPQVVVEEREKEGAERSEEGVSVKPTPEADEKTPESTTGEEPLAGREGEGFGGEEEERRSGEEGGRVFMKFYLLSKLLPIFPS